jgi:hypothetical protein
MLNFTFTLDVGHSRLRSRLGWTLVVCNIILDIFLKNISIINE